MLQLRRARERREIALQLSGELDEDVSAFELLASTSERPREVAARIRRWTGVSLAQQRGWGDSREAFREWRALLEDRGILPLQFTDVPVAVARGFSISERVLPVVAANSKDLPVARTFTLFHELAHLMLNQGGLCDFEGPKTSASKKTEQFCNEVASRVLIPDEALTYWQRTGDDPLVDIQRFASTLKVSREAATLRLIAEGELPWSIYDRVRSRHFEDVKAHADKLKENDGGPSRATLAIANLGGRFLRLVVTAYHEGLIGAPEFADFATVRVKHLPKLESAIFAG